MTWNILTTEPKREFAAARRLVAKHIDVYLPTYRVRVRAAPNTASQWREVDRPIFPGYLFARMDGQGSWEVVHEIFGVSGYLRGPEGPKRISEDVMDAVRYIEKNISEIKDDRLPFKLGDKVRIIQDGSPWQGLEGIIKELDKSERAILQIISSGHSWRINLPVKHLFGQ